MNLFLKMYILLTHDDQEPLFENKNNPSFSINMNKDSFIKIKDAFPLCVSYDRFFDMLRCENLLNFNIFQTEDHYYTSYYDDFRVCSWIRIVIGIKYEYGGEIAVILSDRYYLYNINTIKKFNLCFDESYIRYLFYLGKIDTISYLIKSRLINCNMIKYNLVKNPNVCNCDINCAIKCVFGQDYMGSGGTMMYGHVELLELLKCEGYFNDWDKDSNSKSREFCYYDWFDTASKYGQVEILEWLKNSELEIVYTSRALDGCSKINSLTWWLKSNLPLKYTENAIDHNSFLGNVDVLKWWLKSNLPLKYTEEALHNCIKIDVLTWWLNSNLSLKYDTTSVKHASYCGRIDVLEWWKNSGLEIKYDTDALDHMVSSDNNNINYIAVLEWWKHSELPLKYTENALYRASEYRYLDVLTWWHKSNLPLKIDINNLGKHLQKKVELISNKYKYSDEHAKILEWWKNTGLLL